MVVVLDACVAVKWYIYEQGRERALALLRASGTDFVAPDVFLPEVINALLKNHRAGVFERPLLDRALADPKVTAPQLVSSAMLMDEAIEIAVQLRHPINDCLYLVLAERWDTMMVTADIEFVNRCRDRLPNAPIIARLRTLEDLP